MFTADWVSGFALGVLLSSVLACCLAMRASR